MFTGTNTTSHSSISGSWRFGDSFWRNCLRLSSCLLDGLPSASSDLNMFSGYLLDFGTLNRPRFPWRDGVPSSTRNVSIWAWVQSRSASLDFPSTFGQKIYSSILGMHSPPIWIMINPTLLSVSCLWLVFSFIWTPERDWKNPLTSGGDNLLVCKSWTMKGFPSTVADAMQWVISNRNALFFIHTRSQMTLFRHRIQALLQYLHPRGLPPLVDVHWGQRLRMLDLVSLLRAHLLLGSIDLVRRMPIFHQVFLYPSLLHLLCFHVYLNSVMYRIVPLLLPYLSPVYHAPLLIPLPLIQTFPLLFQNNPL